MSAIVPGLIHFLWKFQFRFKFVKLALQILKLTLHAFEQGAVLLTAMLRELNTHVFRLRWKIVDVELVMRWWYERVWWGTVSYCFVIGWSFQGVCRHWEGSLMASTELIIQIRTQFIFWIVNRGRLQLFHTHHCFINVDKWEATVLIRLLCTFYTTFLFS